MFWNQYPYINLNDLNLDFLLKAIGEMQNEVKNFVTLNAVKYADPIQWDITSQYEKNTIVIDPLTGTAYISVQPVPSGVALNRTDYWTPVFDLSLFITQGNTNLTEHVEDSGVIYSTFALNAGDWLVWNGVLYKALVNMPIGTAYSVDGNIERVTVEEYIKDILTAIANEVQARTTAQGDLNNLTTTDKTNLVAAINEVNTTGSGALALIGDLDDLTTTDKSNLVAAINEVDADVNNLMTSKNGLRIYNVKDYGAIGDNVTDDTAAILAAAADVNATGGILYFPSGAYAINSTIVLTHHGTIVRGSAPQSTYIIPKSNITAIQILGNENNIKSGCGVQDIGISYQGSETSTHYAIDIEYGVNDYVHNVIIGGFKTGIYGTHVGNSFFEHCGIVSNVSGAIGFNIGERSVSIATLNCYVGFHGGAVDNGIGYVANRGDVADFTIKYLDVGNGAYGVAVDGVNSPEATPPADIRIIDLVTDGARTSGIRLTNLNERASVEIAGGWFNEQSQRTPMANCISFSNVNNVNIHDCVFQQLANAATTVNGIVGTTAVGLNICNCKFLNLNSPMSINTVDRAIISNNMINCYAQISPSSYAMNLTVATNLTIDSNQIYSQYSRGINVSGNETIITNNRIYGATTAIVDDSTFTVNANNLIGLS